MSTPEILSKLGIGSGLNNSEIISAIVDAETIAEKEKITRDEADYSNKISAFGLVKSELKTFQLATQSLQDLSPSTHLGSSSSTSTATFTNTGATDNDDINSSLVVTQLASAHSLVSGAVSSTGSLVGAGELTIDFGAFSTTSSTNDTFSANSSKTSFTITTTSSTTLAQLRDSINNTVSDSDSDGTNDLTASIMYNGSNYVLVLKANQGAANAIRVTASDASSSTLSNAFEYNTSDKTLTQSVSAADASFTIDGISMTRSNNTITDLYKGYTLQLLATNSSAITISALENTTTLEGYMQDFVDSYNTLYSTISGLTQANSGLDTSGVLVSDSTATRILRELRAFSTTSITGYKGGPYSMSLLGISTQRDGLLSFNRNTFANTIDRNSNIINAFFTDGISTDNSAVEVSRLTADTNHGTYALSKSGSDYILDSVTLTNSGSNYTSASGNTKGMTLTISDTNVTSANIYYGESLLSKIDDNLAQLLTFNGDIETRIDSLRENLRDIPDRQQKLEDRVAKLTQRYAMQYSNMEGAVAGLKDTGDMISQMLEKND